jgi:hypothetical protein
MASGRPKRGEAGLRSLGSYLGLARLIFGDNGKREKKKVRKRKREPYIHLRLYILKIST